VRALILIVAIALSGCATCRQHETACATAAWIAAGCVALSLHHHTSTHSGTPDYTVTPVNCANGSCK